MRFLASFIFLSMTANIEGERGPGDDADADADADGRGTERFAQVLLLPPGSCCLLIQQRVRTHAHSVSVWPLLLPAFVALRLKTRLCHIGRV